MGTKGFSFNLKELKRQLEKCNRITKGGLKKPRYNIYGNIINTKIIDDYGEYDA